MVDEEDFRQRLSRGEGESRAAVSLPPLSRHPLPAAVDELRYVFCCLSLLAVPLLSFSLHHHHAKSNFFRVRSGV